MQVITQSGPPRPGHLPSRSHPCTCGSASAQAHGCMETNFQAPLPPSRNKLSPCPSRLAGRLACWLADLLAGWGPGTTAAQELTAAGHTRSGQACRLAPRFPARGTKGTCEVRQYRYRVPASANHLGVLAWPSMHGVVAPWAVLQVWRESDDVLPSRVQLLAAQMAQRTAHDMHACDTSKHRAALARPLARLSVSPPQSCLALPASLCLGSL